MSKEKTETFMYQRQPVKVIAGPDRRGRVALETVSGENKGKLFLIKQESLKHMRGTEGVEMWWNGHYFCIRETKPSGETKVISIKQGMLTDQMRLKLNERK